MFGLFRKNDDRHWVRSAAQADVPAFVDFKNRCWEVAYRNLLADEVFESLKTRRDEQIAFWRKKIEKQPLFVAEDAKGKIVGAASANSARTELLLLYVDATVTRQGIGSKLLEETLQNKPASIWVFETNTDGQGFYRHHGFELTAQERPSQLPGRGGATITEVEMRRDAA